MSDLLFKLLLEIPQGSSTSTSSTSSSTSSTSTSSTSTSSTSTSSSSSSSSTSSTSSSSSSSSTSSTSTSTTLLNQEVKLTQVFEMVSDTYIKFQSTSFVNHTEAQVRFDASMFDGRIVQFYFEAIIGNFSGSAGNVTSIELYNNTDGVAISGSELATNLPAGALSTYASGPGKRVRSSPITLSGDKKYTVRLKNSSTFGGIVGACFGARIIVVQAGVLGINLTKTQIQIPLSAGPDVNLGNTYNNISSLDNNYIPVSMAKFFWEENKYTGIASIRYDVVLRTLGSTQRMYSGLWDRTTNTLVLGSEVNTNISSANQLVSSNGLTLSDTHEYSSTAWMTGIPSNGALVTQQTIKGAYLVITLENFTKFKSYWNIIANNFSDTFDSISSVSSFVYDSRKIILFPPDAYLGFSNVKYYFESTGSTSNSNYPAEAILHNQTDSADIMESDILLSSRTSGRSTSVAIAPPVTPKEMVSGLKINKTGVIGKYFLTYLIIEVSA